MTFFFHGAIALGCWAIGLFFIRFWSKVHDRLFLILAASFWLLGAERVLLASVAVDQEGRPLIYILRLIAFLLIIFAVLDKNRGGRRLKERA